MNLEKARYNMIEQQVRSWDVLDENILALLASVHRENFVPTTLQAFAFTDMQIPLAHNQVMMPPREEGRMLQALKITPEERILEIGTGSGFITLLLSKLSQSVLSVEIFPELRTQAMQKLEAAKLKIGTLELGDGCDGWERGGPYDVICVTGSLPACPPSLKRQMKVGGRLFTVIGNAPAMSAVLITRLGPDEWSEEKLYETVIPRLITTRREKNDFEF
jgi:protein-L-isoaspartate(D-aspartate) O-methyltransferase